MEAESSTRRGRVSEARSALELVEKARRVRNISGLDDLRELSGPACERRREDAGKSADVEAAGARAEADVREEQMRRELDERATA